MRRAMLAVWAIAATLAWLACAADASAWSNGPSGANSFGTHDWILREASWLAGQHGVGWLRVGTALRHTDDPDSLFHDFYFHVYDVWGSRYGDAPRKVAQYYAKALASLKAGNRRRASVMVGIMAHYYADICNPLHTDQCAAEERIHAAYENDVQDLTDSPGEHRGWMRSFVYRRVTNAKAAAVSAASASHPSYASLVASFAAHGMNQTVLRITRQSLNRAVLGLADLIVNLGRGCRAGT